VYHGKGPGAFVCGATRHCKRLVGLGPAPSDGFIEQQSSSIIMTLNIAFAFRFSVTVVSAFL